MRFSKVFILFFLLFASLFAAPQAVVFDFGGVMVNPNREAVVHFLCQSLHLSKAEFEKVNNEKRQAVKKGVSEEQFWLDFAKKQKLSLNPNWTKSFKAILKDAIGINYQMYALVKQLKEKKLIIGLLSNVDEYSAKHDRELGLYDLFNPCLLSCEIGLKKPDPKIFIFLIEKLKIKPSDIIFIDDKVENIEGAKEMGIDAIHFESSDQIRLQLERRKLL